MALLTMQAAKAQMPNIGDVRYERPAIDIGVGHVFAGKPQKCIVVDVHPDHLWYTVQFENGFKESYKVPHLKVDGGGEYV